MKPILFISTLALLLTACNEKKSTNSLKSLDELRELKSVTIETGTTYQSDCSKDLQGNYYVASFRTYEINEIKRASVSVSYFRDGSCVQKLFHKFSLANSELVEKGKLLILQYTKASLTVKDTAAASVYNQSGLCGIYDWRMNITRDITNSRECVMPTEEYYYLNANKDDSITVYMCPVKKFSNACPKVRFLPAVQTLP